MRTNQTRLLALLVFLIAGIFHTEAWGQTASCQPNITIDPQARTMCGVDCSTGSSSCSTDYLNFCSFNAQPNTYTCTKPGMSNAMTFYFDQTAQLYRASMANTSPPPPPPPPPAPAPQTYPQSWLDSKTGVMCDKADQNSAASCAQAMGDGSFVWDKSVSSDLSRIEYRYDLLQKKFSDFTIFKKDGTKQTIDIQFNPAFNHYLFCMKTPKRSCEEFVFDPATKTYRKGKHFVFDDVSIPPRTGHNRIAILLFQWAGSPAGMVSSASMRGYMEETFIPFINDASCGKMHITYDIFGPITISADDIRSDLRLDRLISLLDPAWLHFSRYDTVMAVFPDNGGPAGDIRPLLFDSGLTEMITTGDGSQVVGWMNIEDRLIAGRMPQPKQAYLWSFGTFERADGWDCGTVADRVGADADSCRRMDFADPFDPMGTPARDEYSYNAIFRETMGWTMMTDIDDPVARHGVYRLPSLESCEETGGIRIHRGTELSYVLDFSETANRYNGPANFGISIRRNNIFSGSSLLIDTTPNSSGPDGDPFDFHNAMLEVGRPLPMLVGSTIVYPLRKVDQHVDVYIGPPDSGTGPTISMTVTPRRVTLYPTCTLYPPTQPSIVPFIGEVTDDTAVSGNPVLIKETELPGGVYSTSSLGEGIVTPDYSAWFLDASSDLGVGHHRLHAEAYDTFGNLGTSSVFDVYVDPPASPISSYTVAPTSMTLPKPGYSTSSFVFTVHVDPFIIMSRVELYRANGAASVIPMGSGVRSGDGISSWTYTWVVDPVTLGRGDFDFYVKTQDTCGTVTTSEIRRVHVE